MSRLWSDLRFAWRSIGRAPGSAAAAALTLALGVGATTAVFTVLYGVLLRPQPFQRADRLMTLSNSIPAAGVAAFPFSQPELFALRTEPNAFESLAAYVPASLNITGTGTPERVAGARVSANFLDVLGVSPILGRAFEPSADRPGAECVFVARHGFFTQRFGGDVTALGRTVLIDDAPCRLIGVMPPEFRLPATTDLWVRAVFPAASMGRAGLGRQTYRLVGRLRDGITPGRATEIMGEAAARFRAEHPDFYSGSPWRIEIEPLEEHIVGDVGTTLAVLMAAVAVMFLITCANVAHLILSRLIGRERELMLQTALGAARPRLVVQVLAECVLVSVAGSAVGLLLASQAIEIFLAVGPGDVPRAESIRVDASIVLFTVGLSTIVSVLVGLAPALRVLRLNPAARLSHVRGGRPQATRLRDALVVAQVALTLVLVVGAALLIRSLDSLTRVTPGVAAEDRLVAQISPSRSRYPGATQLSAFFGDVLERLAAAPGIVAVGGVSALPLSGQDSRAAFEIEGWTPEEAGRATNVHYRFVSGAYFRAIGVPVIRGRGLERSDVRDAPRVAVVNQTFARTFWRDGNALGRRLSFDRGEHWYMIVGVVADVRHHDLASNPEIEVFLRYDQATSFTAPMMSLVVHASLPPAAIASLIRTRVEEADPAVPVHDIRSMTDVLRASVARPRFRTGLTALFAGIGLFLAGLGTFNVLAQAAAERTFEIAIRTALGAPVGRIVGLAVGHGLRLILVGLATGTVVALGLSRLLSTVLFGIGPTDPIAYGAATLVVLLAGLAACVVPVARVVRVDPLVALRAD